ncbi:MAG: MFS transporter [Armatimonadetes bacterium]|nr:MFS transporter [Armatimonadota bacterium]
MVKAIGRVRWTICGLLFAATTINYLDRQLFALLVPFFDNELRIGPVDIALINASFLLAYGFGMVFVGRLIDRIGTKKGLGWGFFVWTIASAAHALVGGFMGFIAARFMLGVGESANFPASVKTTAEWFPKKERALATGWFNSGTNIGAVLAPFLAVYVAKQFGWRAAFLILGSIGAVWLLFWAKLYASPHDHPSLSPQELEHIEGDAEPVGEKVSFQELFGMRPLYAVAMGKFFSDAPWWFYLAWLPKFLVDQFKLSAEFMAGAVVFVYLIADIGSVLGGWLSSKLIKAGKSVGFSRKVAMLASALCVTPVMLVGLMVGKPDIAGIPTIYVALTIIAIAAGAHQGWSCNLFTLASDTMPRKAVAATVGVMTAFGAVGAALMQVIIGVWVEKTSSYTLPFIMAGTLYFFGLLCIHLILPTVDPTQPKKRVPLPAIVAGAVAMLTLFFATTYLLNRPPYASLDDYVQKRAAQLKSTGQPSIGPDAKVGWMDAKWYVWAGPDGKTKPELIKFDRESRPIVDPKGAKTAHYEGPTVDQVLATTTPPKP